MKTRNLLISASTFIVLCMNAQTVEPTKDAFAYPVRTERNYTLTNKWLYSVATETYQNEAFPTEGALALNSAQGSVRSMALWNDKLLFSSRNDGIPAIIVMDAATGIVEKKIVLDTPGFEYLPCNYITVDAGNNVLVCNINNPSVVPFQIWKIDMETGKGAKLIEGRHEFFGPERFYTFGVLGDVNTDATIWSVGSNTGADCCSPIYRWKITDGAVSEPDRIDIDTSVGFAGIHTMGTSPCVYPVTDNLVYIDGSNTYPTLMRISHVEDDYYMAEAVDGFYDLNGTPSIPNAIDNVTDPGNALTMTSLHNGFAQFSIENEHFFVMPVTAHADYTGGAYPTTPNQAFRLFKYKDENKRTREAEILWTFPRNGFAAESEKSNTRNNYCLAPVAVKVEGNSAMIYSYIGEWGIAAYQFNVSGTGINYPNVSTIAVSGANKMIQFNGEVVSAQVFNITGLLIAKSDGASIAVNPGIYVVKAVASTGEVIVNKIVVR